ncbi:efflux RND transporter periplasmic adaptor subunit [Tautonia sociabilis]|uniref:Efflux RND transporter periplasmic adaptor subunit n=1 Tax=Tautonia sociabilis TaxID=2080755 RepID=A0A432MI24_9BACT|nr:efflux RND transporter periplasmic adaptor subunit [Tautonia sociabilis]RUL87012.1 efflux RND transporter periplasmic adaptor subunit [Tautonia sociabilis]
MKRIVLGVTIALVVVAATGAGLAVARPDLVPAWAGIDPARLPSWARLAAAAPGPVDYGLYCKEHGVPEKFCTLCHEELTGTLLLCTEHGGIPEDICTLCHPEAEAKYDLAMCTEHDLPEQFCGECGNGPGAAAALPDDGWCAAHNMPGAWCIECKAAGGCATGDHADHPGHEDHAGHAHGPAEAEVCRVPLPIVRLRTPGPAARLGIETAPARQERLVPRLLANAETAFDANRCAEVYPRVGGFLREARADLGQPVRRGEVLAVVDSAEISGAKSRFLAARSAAELAKVAYDRTAKLTERGALPAKNELEALTALNQAQAEMMDAEQALRNFGFADADLARIAEAKDTSSLLDVVAPIDGVITARHAVRGEAVQPTTQLFDVTDTSRMWLWVDVYEADIAAVALGQPVRFIIPGVDGAESEGTVTWVGVQVDPTTRTTRVRAELANPDGRLRANLFGQAEIQLGEERQAVVVPKAAVQRKDDADVVFLLQDDGVYRPQRVVARPVDRRDVVEVAWGLQDGQRVVTKGSFLLKTEIMKGAIGAGCCE